MNISSISGFDPTQMAQQMFKKIDSNVDGGIDKSEFAQVAEVTGQDVDEVFSTYDTNEDGVLDESEASQMRPPDGPPPHRLMSEEGMIAQGVSGDMIKEMLDSLNETEEDDEENSFQSIISGILQQNRAQYSISGLGNQFVSEGNFLNVLA